MPFLNWLKKLYAMLMKYFHFGLFLKRTYEHFPSKTTVALTYYVLTCNIQHLLSYLLFTFQQLQLTNVID